MRGLAFPQRADSREPSQDPQDTVQAQGAHSKEGPGSSSNNGGDGALDGSAEHIPIDPALESTAIGSAEMPQEYQQQQQQQQPQQQLQSQHQEYYQPYSQGPQGDPFAPQPPPFTLPVDPEPEPITKPVKKKRKPRKEKECGFCEGDDTKNKDGDPEPLISCSECGRSGHPSCMELGKLSEVMHSYPWACMECKTCEICHEKGDDERILFCDNCDRGWHMDCVDPPIETAPKGDWYCQECPPADLEAFGTAPVPDENQPYRASSVASSSHQNGPQTEDGEGQHQPTSEMDMGRPSATKSAVTGPQPRRTRKPAPGRKKTKRRRKFDSSDEDDDPGSGSDIDNDIRAAASSPAKRSRARVTSPNTSTAHLRLRLPARKAAMSLKGKEREEDSSEIIKGLFDDLLSAQERDTSETSVFNADKVLFERSRLVAEQKLAPRLPPPPPTTSTTISRFSETPETPGGPSSRPLRSAFIQQQQQYQFGATSPAPSTPGAASSSSHQHNGKVPPSGTPSATAPLRIQTIRFGQFDIKTWYDAPFPEEYATIPDGRLWICEFCLKYMKSRFGAVRHRLKCKARHPPGDEIYRDGAVSIFEVDGRKNKIYCQNLCLLSKMFLDHKSLFYDVEPFLFYVIAEVDDFGARFVGYFSKEKRSPKDYNVSCIMTLPVRQRKGWGNYLIDFSYLLSKKEQRTGSPEKPLSSLGALGYRNYWTLSLMRYLQTAPEHIRLEDICAATSMTLEDAHATLVQQNMISAREVTPPPARPSPGQSIKFPKGRKNGMARRALQRTQTMDSEDSPSPNGNGGGSSGGNGKPFVPPTQYEIHWDKQKVVEYLRAWEAKGYLKLKPEKLKWSPFLLARTKKTEALEATETSQLKLTRQPSTSLSSAVEEQPPPPPQPLNLGLFDSSPLVADDTELPAFEPVPPLSPAMKSVEDDASKQLEQDRLLACKLDGSTSLARKLRSRSSQASGSTPRQQPRGHSPLATPRTDEEHGGGDTDEALAVRLALEEERLSGSRQTRSRTDSMQSRILKKRTDSYSGSVSPRKRRRVEDDDTPHTNGIVANDASPVQPSREPVAAMNGDNLRSNGYQTEPTPTRATFDHHQHHYHYAPNGYSNHISPSTQHGFKYEDFAPSLANGRRSDDTVYSAPELNGHSNKDMGDLGLLAALAATLQPAVDVKSDRSLSGPGMPVISHPTTTTSGSSFGNTAQYPGSHRALQAHGGDNDLDGEYDEDTERDPDCEMVQA